MKTVKTIRKHRSPILKKLLEEIPPLEKEKVRVKMLLAAKIADAIEHHGLNKLQFSQKMGVRPSLVTKWLSGTHNFTEDTLTTICWTLDIDRGSLYEPNLEAPQKVV